MLEALTTFRPLNLLRRRVRSAVFPDHDPGVFQEPTCREPFHHHPHALGIVRRIEEY